MKRLIEHTFKLQEALHTGDDKTLGIVKPFRREEVMVNDAIPVYSYFDVNNEDEQKLRIKLLALYIYKLHIPEQNNRKAIWTEMRNAVIHAATKGTTDSFHSTLVSTFDLADESMSNQYTKIHALDILDLFTNYEIVNLIIYDDVVHSVMARCKYLYDSYRLFSKSNKEQGKERSELFKAFDEGTGETNEVHILEEKAKEIVEEIQSGQRKKRIVSHSNIISMPTVAGNTIRGKFRRDIMNDFCERVGIDYDIFDTDITDISNDNQHLKLKKSVEKNLSRPIDNYLYHSLFTGGTLTGGFFEDEKEVDDLSVKEKLILHIPPIAFFACAIAKKMFDGLLMVHSAFPKCIELGNGNESVQRLMNISFGTRNDSEKTQQVVKLKTRYIIQSVQSIEGVLKHFQIPIKQSKKLTSAVKGANYEYIIIASEKEIEEIKQETGIITDVNAYNETHQMRYQYETMVRGAELTHSFGHKHLTSPLLKSCFGYMLDLFSQNTYLAAKSSIGRGLIDCSDLKEQLAKLIEEDENYNPKFYLDYLEKHKEAIIQFVSPDGIQKEIEKK